MRVLGRKLGLTIELDELELGEGKTVIDAIKDAAAGDRHVFILDLPLDEMQDAASALADGPALLFEVCHPDTELRQSFCPDGLFYTTPSRATAADALAQYLCENGWRDVLMLNGPEETDEKDAEAFKNAAEKLDSPLLPSTISFSAMIQETETATTSR